MLKPTSSTIAGNWPLLYSFRRCPYAMRARLALASAKKTVILREINLKNKPQEFLSIAPKATVPCLVTPHKTIHESLDIMLWALDQNDPEHWLEVSSDAFELIQHCDGPFKNSLDLIKYQSRHKNINISKEQKVIEIFLNRLNGMLTQKFLYGDSLTIVDIAVLPFVRQYALIDKEWFYAQNWINLIYWLDSFLISKFFRSIQTKYPVWTVGNKITFFPD